MKKTTLLYSLLFTFLIVNQSCKKDSMATTSAASNTSSNQLETDASLSDTSLLCYLPFRGNLNDKSGHGNNGVLNGSISYVADRFGNASRAASFAASNAWIEIPEARFVGLKTMTIAMDFYPTTTSYLLKNY